ncbi:hypothetical protein ACFE04_021556 [Oxalis oulophora]
MTGLKPFQRFYEISRNSRTTKKAFMTYIKNIKIEDSLFRKISIHWVPTTKETFPESSIQEETLAWECETKVVNRQVISLFIRGKSNVKPRIDYQTERLGNHLQTVWFDWEFQADVKISLVGTFEKYDW